MEHRSTSDLLRDLQAISAELARRHAAEQQDGGGTSPMQARCSPSYGSEVTVHCPITCKLDAGIHEVAHTRTSQ